MVRNIACIACSVPHPRPLHAKSAWEEGSFATSMLIALCEEALPAPLPPLLRWGGVGVGAAPRKQLPRERER